ncbi:ATP-dependent DNA ligase [Candidatus Manganitrophus noduliformans]|uniref:Probable DNA ligase n=1 Tax=Candidatus Manganitrophus noduliformans TaxID=2606439 RepID=A0A7X6DLZ7_9BACT|nr:ATP-dependent DNA ligase [Candidatus Manganitrophus noduliformans]NKE69562.1 ATP-dependent DNA ligase [Candidatus Manganitrophus noduliformans]
MQLKHLVQLTARLRETARKNEKIRLIADFLKQTADHETALSALYLTGTLPQGKIGVGWRMIQAALSEGKASPLSLLSLSLQDVDDHFAQIAAAEGSGSAGRKVALLGQLFQRGDPEVRRFLSQLIMGELRQGALEGLVLEAIAKGAGLATGEVRQAMMFSGNVGEVARVALEEGGAGLRRFSLCLFSPVSPMLAQTADTISEALERLGEAGFEFKIDGARIQVHKGGERVRIFTRQLQEVTERLPEIVAWTRALPVAEIILEGEAIALRPDGTPQPFQMTMRRFGRMKNVEAMRREIPLTSFFFDCLYREGRSLLSLPYRKRFENLSEIIPPDALIPQIITADREEVARFQRRALEAGHEGLMAKGLAAPYTAGQRGSYWLKLKRAKTLDLVVLAAEWGNGRRSGWLSNLHLGALDPESGQFIMLGKTFKGLTDEMLQWQTEKFLAMETARDAWTVYLRPELVVEVAFSDVQASPRYPAGMALRFARVKRYRPDKPADEADTLQTVMEIFRRETRLEMR